MWVFIILYIPSVYRTLCLKDWVSIIITVDEKVFKGGERKEEKDLHVILEESCYILGLPFCPWSHSYPCAFPASSKVICIFFFFWEVRVTRGGGVSVLLSSSCIFILSYFVFVLNNPRLSMRVMCVSETLKNIIDCSTLGLKRSHASLSFCPQRKYMSKCQGLKQRGVIWCCQNQIFTSRKCISFINIINTCFQVWILRMIFSEENRLI